MGALSFRTLLDEAGVPLDRARLLRHADTRRGVRRTVYSLWRDDRLAFERYQSRQSSRSLARADWWAAFVVDRGRVLFVGLYEAKLIGPSTHDEENPLSGETWPAGSHDIYETSLSPKLTTYRERLCIEWTQGLPWVRLPDQEWPITEVSRTAYEQSFPGFARFREPLSKLAYLPLNWKAALETVGGVYLLSCPATGKQYVGSAYGAGGFLQRWSVHAATGGDALAMQQRMPSDYEVSVLQLFDTEASAKEVIEAEHNWMHRLGTRVHGLNA